MSFPQVVFESSAYIPEQIIEPGLPEIVFSGRSNVGKSSMINRLINRKSLARVSSEPGKTVSINFYNCGRFRLVDLPGYGFARVSKVEKQKWAALVEGYLSQNRPVALVIQLIDSRRPPTQDDADMLGYLVANGLPFVIAATKCDKLGKTELAARKIAAPAEIGAPDEKVIFFSSLNGEGVDALEKLISQSLGDPGL